MLYFFRYAEAHEYFSELQVAFEKKNKTHMEVIAETAYKKLKEYAIKKYVSHPEIAF